MRCGGMGRPRVRTPCPRCGSSPIGDETKPPGPPVHSIDRSVNRATRGEVRMRAATVQLESTKDRGRNLESTERLVRAAADEGATLVVLPEHFDLRGRDEDYLRYAEPLDGPTVERVRALARELRIDLIAGSVAERRPGHEKPSNTSLHIG